MLFSVQNSSFVTCRVPPLKRKEGYETRFSSLLNVGRFAPDAPYAALQPVLSCDAAFAA
jgi:hypothetical protein